MIQVLQNPLKINFSKIIRGLIIVKFILFISLGVSWLYPVKQCFAIQKRLSSFFSIMPSIRFLAQQNFRPTPLFYQILKPWNLKTWNLKTQKLKTQKLKTQKWKLSIKKPYKNLIIRLLNDPQIKDYSIHPFYIEHFFTKRTLSHNHPSIQILLEKRLKYLVEKLIQKYDKSKKPKKDPPKNIYTSFLNKASFKIGRVFLRQNYSLLKKIEDQYQVDKEYISSILFIESRFGKVTGKNLVLDVYNTLYHYDGSLIIRKLTKNIKNRVYKKECIFQLKSLINKKKAWAYKQLKSLLIMDYVHDIDVHSLRGSWAGAFGYPQFIPSSYLSWAQDGDGDGRVHLFDWKDVFASIANYLKAFGFKKGFVKDIKEAIYAYNLSTDYVEAVYQYAHALKKKS